MMYCYKCGAEIDDDALFCPKCGCPLKRQSQNNNTKSPCYAPDYKAPSPSKKPIYKKWWFWVLALIVVSNLIGESPEMMRARNQREAEQLLAARSQQTQTEPVAEPKDDGYTEEEQAAAAKEYYEKIGYDPTDAQDDSAVVDDGVSVLEQVGANSGISYSGSGDDYIEIDPLDDLWYIEITGNQSSGHFAVKGYDAAGDYKDLFVNTVEPYRGSVFELEQSTRLLEINAPDSWSVKIKPLAEAPRLTASEMYSGVGDAVLLLPSGCTSAKITGNGGSNHFAVKGYGNYCDLLVNTIDPYNGTVRLGKNTVLLTITADGGWQITVQ